MEPLCNEGYTRPRADMPLRCQYIAGHPSDRHSWFAVQAQDEMDQLAAAQAYHAPADEQKLLEHIEGGVYDSILEALLNAAHNRKRTIRGLRGFPTLERRASRR